MATTVQSSLMKSELRTDIFLLSTGSSIHRQYKELKKMILVKKICWKMNKLALWLTNWLHSHRILFLLWSQLTQLKNFASWRKKILLEVLWRGLIININMIQLIADILHEYLFLIQIGSMDVEVVYLQHRPSLCSCNMDLVWMDTAG